MEFLEIKQSELKKITMFLIENKVIFHPLISPKGQPDFTNHRSKNFATIIDRNILTQLIRLLTTGQLKDDYSRRMVSSLMLWAQINNISINSGLALSEYAYSKRRNDEASTENNLFLKAFNYYGIQVWLDLALDRRKTIPILKLNKQIEYSFFNEYDHFKMHYLEMLIIARLYFNNEMTIEDKFKHFHKWVYENILICKYTTFYFALLLGRKVNTFRKIGDDFNALIAKCKNQAWDLSYLFLWSTLYYYEDEADTVYLFATMDGELKDIFVLTHKESNEVYNELFGNSVGNKIVELISEIYKAREKPEFENLPLDDLIEIESEKLREVIVDNQ